MDVVPPVDEDAVMPPLCVGPDRVGPDRDPPSAGGEAWNALLFVAELESEVVSVFDRHRELAAAAYWRSSSAGTGFGQVQAQALWDRWMRIVSGDRIYRGCKICVALHELPRD